MTTIKRYLRRKKRKHWTLDKVNIVTQIFSSLILGVMGLYLMYSANIIADTQAELAEDLALYQKAKFSPNYAIEIIPTKDVLTNQCFEQSMEIFNVGENGVEIETSVQPRLKIDHYSSEYKHTEILPLKGYFKIQSPSRMQSGLVARYSGENNEENLNMLIDSIQLKASSIGRFNTLFYYDFIVYISYKDIAGVQHTKYFIVDNFNQKELSEEEYREELKPINEAAIIANLDQQNVDEIIEYINKQYSY